MLLTLPLAQRLGETMDVVKAEEEEDLDEKIQVCPYEGINHDL